ncbi:MAG TPA: hypothetical protein VF526_21315 [Solirubrobacteraceae bacterium]
MILDDAHFSPISMNLNLRPLRCEGSDGDVLADVTLGWRSASEPPPQDPTDQRRQRD